MQRRKIYMAVIICCALRITTSAVNSRCKIYESSSYGFGSNILGLLLTVATLNKSSIVYFDETSWLYKCQRTPGWSYFFSGPIPKVMPHSADDTLIAKCERIPYEGSERSGHEILKNLEPHRVFGILRRSVQRIWRLSARQPAAACMHAAAG